MSTLRQEVSDSLVPDWQWEHHYLRQAKLVFHVPFESPYRLMVRGAAPVDPVGAWAR